MSACVASRDGAGDSPFTLIYRSAWNNGIDPALTIQAPRRDSIETVPVPAFGGVALKTSMKRTDDFTQVANGTPRTEVVFDRVARFAVGHEYEIRWSTMIPQRYRIDSQQPEIIAQVHQSARTGSPPFSLMLDNAHYRVEVRSGPGRPLESFEFGSPENEKGKIITWLLRYRPDDSGTGARTDLYKDGVRVVHCMRCPNAYKADDSAYLKIGVYKWWWQTRPSDVSERTMYYGDVEIRELP